MADIYWHDLRDHPAIKQIVFGYEMLILAVERQTMGKAFRTFHERLYQPDGYSIERHWRRFSLLRNSIGHRGYLADLCLGEPITLMGFGFFDGTHRFAILYSLGLPIPAWSRKRRSPVSRIAH